MRKSDITRITISEPRLRKAIRHRLNEAVSEQLDQEYMQAVQAGDIAKAEAMVRKAAANAGYNVEAYHGTNGYCFTKFEQGHHSNGNIWGDGFYFAESEKEAQLWGDCAAAVECNDDMSQTLHCFLSVHNPLELIGTTIIDGLDNNVSEAVINELDTKYDADLIDAIRNRRSSEIYDSYDYSRVGDVIRSLGYDAVQGYYYDQYHIMVFSPRQIKSADAVTYGDNGQIIPLSRRFSVSDDIRFEDE